LIKQIFKSVHSNIAKPFEINYLERIKIQTHENIRTDSKNLRYVVFDTETTGLDIKKDTLLSIGGVAIYGSSLLVQESFYELIKVERGSGKDIPIHGIMPKESLDGKDEKSALLAFLKFIDNSILVAHHIDFDLEFLNKSLSKYTPLKILNDSIDTAKLAERIEEKTNPNLIRENRKQFQLDSLCKKYEIPIFPRHHALSDSITTGILFLILQKKWMRLGNDQLKTLYF
jgi:DNA polymerase III subunit epsilon